MEVGNMRLCVLSTDSVFVIFLIFENKIQCCKNVRNNVTNTYKTSRIMLQRGYILKKSLLTLYYN